MSNLLPVTSGKFFVAISLSLLGYVLLFNHYRVNRIYYYLVIWLIVLSLVQKYLFNALPTRIFLIHLLLWIMPFLTVKLTAQSLFIKKSVFVSMVTVAYLLTILTGVLNSGKLSGQIFHSSFLALLGTIIAIEILRSKKQFRYMFLSMLLFMIPILGNLRQYLYVILPIFIYVGITRKQIFKMLIVVFVMFIIVQVTPLGNHYSSLRTDTASKGETFAEFYSSASDLGDSTFELRRNWWVDVIKSVFNRNILFGHSLNYQFNPFQSQDRSRDSSMLHNYFISGLADGGIVLFSILIAIFVKSIKKALYVRDYYSLLIIYAFIIALGMNALGLSLKHSFIVFFAFGYYENMLNISVREKQQAELTQRLKN